MSIMSEEERKTVQNVTKEDVTDETVDEETPVDEESSETKDSTESPKTTEEKYGGLGLTGLANLEILALLTLRFSV